jgi:protein transport protein SEC24
MRLMKSLSASNMISFLYPRLIAIHNLHDDVGSMIPVARREGDQRLLLPPFLRPSQMRLEQHGAYLLGQSPYVGTPWPWWLTINSFDADNGDTSVIWLAAGVSPAIVRDLYGTEDLQELDVTMVSAPCLRCSQGPLTWHPVYFQTSLPNLPTKLSEQVRTIVSHFESTRGGRQLPLIIARQGIDNGSEYAFGNLMVEDGNNDAMNYPDYLC